MGVHKENLITQVNSNAMVVKLTVESILEDSRLSPYDKAYLISRAVHEWETFLQDWTFENPEVALPYVKFQTLDEWMVD